MTPPGIEPELKKVTVFHKSYLFPLFSDLVRVIWSPFFKYRDCSSVRNEKLIVSSEQLSLWMQSWGVWRNSYGRTGKGEMLIRHGYRKISNIRLGGYSCSVLLLSTACQTWSLVLQDPVTFHLVEERKSARYMNIILVRICGLVVRFLHVVWNHLIQATI